MRSEARRLRVRLALRSWIYQRLPARDRRMINLVRQGDPTCLIARELRISEATVNKRTSSICFLMGITRWDLTGEARERNRQDDRRAS